MKHLIKTILLCAALVGCCCAARPSIPGTRMIAHEIRVGGDVYSFDVPEGESKDFPRQEVFNAFEFSSDETPYKPGGYSMVEKFWDYKNGIVGFNQDGTMVFQFRVRQFSSGFVYEEDNIGAIKKYIFDELSSSYDKLNANYLRDGNSHMMIKIPENIEQIEFAGKDAFHYQLGGASDFDAYVIPLNEKYFLQIQFDFIDNNHGRGMEWRKKAQADADQIRASMKIRTIESRP
jgi:hypothetical protein